MQTGRTNSAGRRAPSLASLLRRGHPGLIFSIAALATFAAVAISPRAAQAQRAEPAARDVPAPHLQLKLAQTAAVVSPGNRVTLVAELALPPDLHVYAPGVEGYKPIALQLNASPKAAFTPPKYPPSKILALPATHENVPVFEGTFRITQDVTISSDPNFAKAIAAGPAPGTPLTLGGSLLYQACTSQVCYPPDHVAVSWRFTVVPVQHK